MEELKSAVPPIVSIISKCERRSRNTRRGRHSSGGTKKIIHAMKVSKTLLEDRLETSAVLEKLAGKVKSARRK